MIVVTKPGGLYWDGVFYKYGDRLPDAVREHPSYPVLLAVNYIVERASRNHETGNEGGDRLIVRSVKESKNKKKKKKKKRAGSV